MVAAPPSTRPPMKTHNAPSARRPAGSSWLQLDLQVLQLPEEQGGSLVLLLSPLLLPPQDVSPGASMGRGIHRILTCVETRSGRMTSRLLYVLHRCMMSQGYGSRSCHGGGGGRVFELLGNRVEDPEGPWPQGPAPQLGLKEHSRSLQEPPGAQWRCLW